MIGTSWYEAADYCNWLSEREGISPDQWCYETNSIGKVTELKAKYLSLTGYRLPMEAEMEFATRAGAMTSRFYGESEDLLGNYGWFSRNSGERSWPVGSKKPNDLGLFDMHGNVWCWCQCEYKAYPKGKNGQVFEDKEYALDINRVEHRMLRGGAFLNPASRLRSAFRDHNVPTTHGNLIGFRPARSGDGVYFWSAGRGWGEVAFRSGTVVLTVKGGELAVSRIRLPTLPGAALPITRRRKSGWARMPAGSLPATRAIVRRAQHQFCRVVLGRSAAAIRVMRSAKDGWSGLAKALRETCFSAMG